VAERPAPEPPTVDLQPVLDQLAERHVATPDEPEGVADELRRIRQDLDERLNGIYDRLGGVEWRMGERLDPLVHRVDALERLATDLARQDDVRRATDRIVGEVKAVDDRFGTIADDLRVIKQVRDGLQSLTDGIDGVRQLTAKAASSQQLAELSRELGAVLGEIAAARNQVLRVEQQAPTPSPSDVRAVTHDVDQLSRRIDRLADAVEQQGTAPPQVSLRLRRMSDAARQLGNGVLEDLRRNRRSGGPR
jgi:methyl-accepting chemotaxis protein